MRYQKELESYYYYITAYYPQSLILENFNTHKKEFIKIFKSIDMIDIYSDYTYNELICTDLLNDLRYLLLKLLYITPANDSFYISITFRAISETCLKLFLSTDKNNNRSLDDIKKSSYRDLWRHCKTIDKTSNCKLTIDRLNMMFKTNSDIIHIKELTEQNIDYLENIMERKEYSYQRNDFNRNINDIFEFIIIHLKSIYSLEYDRLSRPHKHLYKFIHN